MLFWGSGSLLPGFGDGPVRNDGDAIRFAFTPFDLGLRD
jgi:hypothetical protein